MKKEFDHAKEKAKIAIINPVIQTEVLAILPCNGMSVPENNSTTPTKYEFTHKSLKFIIIYNCYNYFLCVLYITETQ